MGPADNNNDRRGDFLGRVADALENRLVMLIVASLLSVGVVKVTPQARSDPYTGTMGAALEARVRKLEQVQALDDKHRQDALEWKLRIRDLEKTCVECMYQVRELKLKQGEK